MNAKVVERYRLRIAATPPAPARATVRARRHDAITRDLGTYAKYQDWAEKLRDTWKAK